jgi:hypothetical protein
LPITIAIINTPLASVAAAHGVLSAPAQEMQRVVAKMRRSHE